jgi:hypothetical protein
MITNSTVKALPTTLGHRKFQYPDHEGQAIYIPKGAQLTALNWTGGGEWMPYTWDVDGTQRVVWIKK